LRDRFLAGRIENGPALARRADGCQSSGIVRAGAPGGRLDPATVHTRQARERLDQQRRLADARITAEQHHAPRDQAAADQWIELADATRGARTADLCADLGDRHRGLSIRHARGTRPRRRDALDLLDERVPLLAGRAAPEPLALRVAARLAAVDAARRF